MKITEVVIAGAKLTRYLFDIHHPAGASKAKFFIARGFPPTDPARLANALNEQLAADETERTILEVADKRSETRLIAVGPLACPDGSAPRVKSIWKLDAETGQATLVTAYPARHTTAS